MSTARQQQRSLSGATPDRIPQGSPSEAPEMPSVAASDRPRPPPNRRRDKQQLSCNMCRRRKVRCDRQQPCETCLARGLALSCAYPTSYGPDTPGSTHMTGSRPPRPTVAPRGNVPDRIQELERLVVTLMQQVGRKKYPAPTCVPDTPSSSGADVFGQWYPTRAAHSPPSTTNAEDASPSPAPSELGRISPNGVCYVGSAHWAAVLDSIAELRDHFEKEELRAQEVAVPEPVKRLDSEPLLLYGCPEMATEAEIIASVPPRPVVDRLVSKFFNAGDMASAILHSGRFLRQYEKFWDDPHKTPIVWVGMLFSIMCLAAQAQSPPPGQPSSLGPAHSDQMYKFKQKTVQCLVLGRYTKAGPFVLETLILYLAAELFLCDDAEFGIYILHGMIINLATRMGYHRDPRHFPELTAVDGEIRRRVWSTVRQIDVTISTQMGLPLKVKAHQTDTDEPRNLLDSDLDEGLAELPPSRPETEVTAMLYGLAKRRTAAIGGLIIDFTTDIRPHTYDEVMELDAELERSRASIPAVLAWRPLTQCITQSPQLNLQRLWIDIIFLRMRIILHRKYLLQTRGPQSYSRAACLRAAMRILEFQRIVDEETQPDGQLYEQQWRMCSLLYSDFLLATSILCSLLSDEALDVATGLQIRALLQGSLEIWRRSSSTSKEARKAAGALEVVLGSGDDEEAEYLDTPFSQASSVNLEPGVDFTDVFPLQENPSGFDFPFAFDPMSVDASGIHGDVSVDDSYPDILSERTDSWIGASDSNG